MTTLDSHSDSPDRRKPRSADDAVLNRNVQADQRDDSDQNPPEMLVADVPQPINWDLLDADQAYTAWHELNAWVNWLRRTYALPATVVPPYWHRHPELVWELSALHLHWLGTYHPDQHASAAIGWHRDFADARQRLRDWVAQSGTRLDQDRPLRQTAWPGEPADANADRRLPINTGSRDDDFMRFVTDDISRRQVGLPTEV